MYLHKINITNFKNISKAELEFSPKINCISGNNGCGKTNLLDAVYYLSMTKSFFNVSDLYNISFGEKCASINGIYNRSDGTQEKISIGIGDEKIIKKNGKAYSKKSDHIGLIPIVMVSPADTALVNESGEERRRFMNFILSQIDKVYLNKIQNYNQLLLQRNKLLKTPDFSKDLLDIISERMCISAAYIYEKRVSLCNNLKIYLKDYYNKLSGGREEIDIKYVSDLDKGPLENLFKSSYERDILFKYTTVGIQRDDMSFLINGYPIKKIGSQGQQKSFLISLKLAQFSLMKEVEKKLPILLLDDVFDKLDFQRVEYLLSLVSGDMFGQIFITDSNKVRINKILESASAESKCFSVVDGNYSVVD